MSNYDQLNRFLFNDVGVRGEIVRLKESLKPIVHNYEYPAPVQQLLSEMAAATSLLAAILKFDGEIGLQIQSEGPVKYAVINATDNQTMRGVARWDDSIAELPSQFNELMQKGVLVITITPNDGERYQGIVALDKPSLSECLEAYFSQSEQLATRVRLMTDIAKDRCVLAGGILLQVLPDSSEATSVADKPEFEHLVKLIDTLTQKEMFGLPVQEILYRIYHQENVELFEGQSVSFACTCSKERSASALKNIDKSELLALVKEQGAVTMNCQYCHTEYSFDAIDVEAIHSGNHSNPTQTQ